MKNKFVGRPDPNREADAIKRAMKIGQAKLLGKAKGRPVYKLTSPDAEAIRPDIAEQGGLAVGNGYNPPMPGPPPDKMHDVVDFGFGGLGSGRLGVDSDSITSGRTDYPGSKRRLPGGVGGVLGGAAASGARPGVLGVGGLAGNPEVSAPDQSTIPPGMDPSQPAPERGNPARDAYMGVLGEYGQHLANAPTGMEPNVNPEDMRQAMLLDRLRQTGTYSTRAGGLGSHQVYDPVNDRLHNQFNVGVDTRTRAQKQGGQVIPFVDPALERRFGPAEQRVSEAMQAPGQALERYMQQGKGLESYMDRLKPLGLGEPKGQAEPKGPTSLEQMLVQAKSPEEQQQILDMMRRQSEATRAPRGGEDGGGGYSKQEKVDMEQHILAIEDAMNDPGTSPEDRAALQGDADKLNAALRGADYVVSQRQSKAQREESARRQAESDALAYEDRGMRMEDRKRAEQDRMMSQDADSAEGEALLNDIVTELQGMPVSNDAEGKAFNSRLDSMIGKELADLQRKYGRTMLASGEKDLSPQNVRAFVLAELNRRRAAPNPVGLIPGRSDPIGEETSGSVRQDYEDAVGVNKYNPYLMQESALQKAIGMDPRTGILRYLYERGRGAVNRFMGRNQR